MLTFRRIEIEDADRLRKYLLNRDESSCENNFINLLIWQDAYHNMWAEQDDCLLLKSGTDENSVFSAPFGGNFERGIELIQDYAGTEYPPFWAQEGARFEKLKAYFKDRYTYTEQRDAFDYLYRRDDLAALAGKKYHAKRNHISAFSKKFRWEYRPITADNAADIKQCAEQWYSENRERMDSYLLCEKKGIFTLLDHMERLRITGGAVYADGAAVAFTLGSPINDRVFDIHIEKALADYAEGYTVINREFAANALDAFEFINREDDMGLDGLRRAKLSYKPAVLLKKYSCRRAPL